MAPVGQCQENPERLKKRHTAMSLAEHTGSGILQNAVSTVK